jgi:hypothetical protein
MAAAMVSHMADLSSELIRGSTREIADYQPNQNLKLPSWIGTAA